MFHKGINKTLEPKILNQQEILLTNQITSKPSSQSKISSKLQSLMSKDSTSKQERQDTNSSSLSTEDNEEPTAKMVLITMSLIVNNQVQRSSFVINCNDKIESVIIKSITHFNALFAQENTQFRLNPDPTLYSLKQTRKNGFPKHDMPNFNLKTSLNETNHFNFSLTWKANSENYEDYFIRLQFKEKGWNCKGCTIF